MSAVPEDLPVEHLVPVGEEGHELDGCSCSPFGYVRLSASGAPVGTEVRHNAFEALPVDEEALEVAQGRRSALDDVEGLS